MTSSFMVSDRAHKALKQVRPGIAVNFNQVCSLIQHPVCPKLYLYINFKLNTKNNDDTVDI